jgi:hypothetical protein
MKNRGSRESYKRLPEYLIVRLYVDNNRHIILLRLTNTTRVPETTESPTNTRLNKSRQAQVLIPLPFLPSVASETAQALLHAFRMYLNLNETA